MLSILLFLINILIFGVPISSFVCIYQQLFMRWNNEIFIHNVTIAYGDRESEAQRDRLNKLMRIDKPGNTARGRRWGMKELEWTVHWSISSSYSSSSLMIIIAVLVWKANVRAMNLKYGSYSLTFQRSLASLTDEIAWPKKGHENCSNHWRKQHYTSISLLIEKMRKFIYHPVIAW